MNDKEQIIERIIKMSKRMYKDALDMALAAGGNSSHFGGGLSIIDITATLYGGILRINPKEPNWSERDRFILSKGHGVLGYYTALAESGFFEKEELLNFEKTNSFLPGHPVINREKGIEFTNGSLGMGLSVGIGVALAGKKNNKGYKVYVLMGDGECNEGSVWEAAMAAANYKLNNIVAIIDKNNYQLGGLTGDVMNLGDMVAKWKSFGWETIEVDGHNIEQLYDVFSHENMSGKPLCVVANTIKGKGVSFAENNNAWHHAPLSKTQYIQAIEELDFMLGGSQNGN